MKRPLTGRWRRRWGTGRLTIESPQDLPAAASLGAKGKSVSKLKNVKKKFHEVNDHNRGSGRGQLDWPYFDLCQNIWGLSHSANPVSIQGSLNATPPAPASPASTERSDEEADSQNVENGTESQTGKPLAFLFTVCKRAGVIIRLVFVLAMSILISLMLKVQECVCVRQAHCYWMCVGGRAACHNNVFI